jgi:Methyltransferase domain
MRSFDDLLAEAMAVDVTGWDFSWFAGRATEERPPWRYQGLLGDRMARAGAAVDVQTGGGEVLAGIDRYPPTAVATEGWPPNVRSATRLLHPRGVVVVAAPEAPPWPFADDAFDLVTSRHPATVWWSEIARVLCPGGTYLAQHVGAESVFELAAEFLDITDEHRRGRRADLEAEAARAAGLDVVQVRTARTRMAFSDIAAVIVFLRKVVWIVPGFDVDRHMDVLRQLDDRIRRTGPFVAQSARTLLEARKPENSAGGDTRTADRVAAGDR